MADTPRREDFYYPADFLEAARKHLCLSRPQLAERLTFIDDDYGSLEAGLRAPSERMMRAVVAMVQDHSA